MLGSELGRMLENHGLEYIGTDREVNILDSDALTAFTAGKDISFIINCAAYTAVDKAEEKTLASLEAGADKPRSLGSKKTCWLYSYINRLCL